MLPSVACTINMNEIVIDDCSINYYCSSVTRIMKQFGASLLVLEASFTMVIF